MWALFRWLRINPARHPVQLGNDLFLVSQDRDNFFVSKGGKVAQVYAPHASWFGRKLDFHGVVAQRWQSPFHHESISPEEKRAVESALLEHLRQLGYNPVWIVEDPNEPVLKVTSFGN